MKFFSSRITMVLLIIIFLLVIVGLLVCGVKNQKDGPDREGQAELSKTKIGPGGPLRNTLAATGHIKWPNFEARMKIDDDNCILSFLKFEFFFIKNGFH
jgi:hypothetical protein